MKRLPIAFALALALAASALHAQAPYLGGTVTVSEPGVIAPKQVMLTAGSGGVGQADVAFTNLTPGTHTLVVAYSGDSRYYPNTQNVRLLEAHRRAAGH